MTRVSALRQMANDAPELLLAVREIKHFQAQRFIGTYPDLLESATYSGCASFFLQDLYSALDYSQRDAQFARIANALELAFPQAVVATAVNLAQLHCLTEELDLAMAQCWLQNAKQASAARYVSAWRSVGRRADRDWQLATVLNIGRSLGELTRKRGLRLMLKMMRRPAELAGLGSLQAFLESGFDHFGGISGKGGSVENFLNIIKTRESYWMNRLFDANAIDCENEIGQMLMV